MSGLVAFISARLDEDQALAQAALESVRGVEGELADAAGPCIGDAGYLHIKRYDPARMLREIATERAILVACSFHLSDPVIDYGDTGPDLARDILRHRAAAWPDHPDYAAALVS